MTSDTPRCEIAVIVPVHNAETFLPDCLNALADQRFNDFRCILVDDGSTDSSPSLCDDMALNDPPFSRDPPAPERRQRRPDGRHAQGPGAGCHLVRLLRCG